MKHNRIQACCIFTAISSLALDGVNPLIKAADAKLRLALFVLARFCVMPACVLAQTLPTMPPTNYDQVISSNAHGTVASVSYYSSVVASNRTMEVYTPPGYSTNKTYPVIIVAVDVKITD